jgi:hypothetical protein
LKPKAVHNESYPLPFNFSASISHDKICHSQLGPQFSNNTPPVVSFQPLKMSGKINLSETLKLQQLHEQQPS